MIPKSRHPKINYWFWKDSTLTDNHDIKTLDRMAASSRFDTLTLTDRGCGFWDPIHKERMRALVAHAHELGLKIVLQLWPMGACDTDACFISSDEAAAIALDIEATVTDGRAVVRSVDQWTRGGERAPAIDSELLCAYAFQKTAEGFYKEGTLIDVTDRAEVVFRSPTRVSAVLTLPELEGYTVFAVAAHYHRVADAFSDRAIADYKAIMDFYADVPFDGIALDEFKTLCSSAPHTMEGQNFRGRMFGRAFARTFAEQTGMSLNRTLLDMRYCPEGKDEIRMAAINRYFDHWRHGPTRVENFVTDYSKQLFGADAFLGFHNTFHNALTNDEIWNTGCNWWEVKRDYAQTDENMSFPVRMGLACRAREAIVYDMYYHHDKTTFFAKCMKEAAYGSRLHYHAIDDGSRWGLDTGTEEFLAEVARYEDHAELLNLFEPSLPAMSLLCVFGFPAQLNWYPDEKARAQFDVNQSLGVIEKADALWRMGYHNALAPDDAIVRGEITLGTDGRFDYCGHKFDAMLFLYPEYAKAETVAFLKAAAKARANFKVIGALSRGFDGSVLDGGFLAPFTVAPTTPDTSLMLKQTAEALGLRPNDIENGCRLSDGSVVMSHYESVRDGEPCTARFVLDGETIEVNFIGSFAIKTDGRGQVQKLVSGELLSLSRRGEELLPDLRGRDVLFGV